MGCGPSICVYTKTLGHNSLIIVSRMVSRLQCSHSKIGTTCIIGVFGANWYTLAFNLSLLIFYLALSKRNYTMRAFPTQSLMIQLAYQIGSLMIYPLNAYLSLCWLLNEFKLFPMTTKHLIFILNLS